MKIRACNRFQPGSVGKNRGRTVLRTEPIRFLSTRFSRNRVFATPTRVRPQSRCRIVVYRALESKNHGFSGKCFYFRHAEVKIGREDTAVEAFINQVLGLVPRRSHTFVCSSPCCFLSTLLSACKWVKSAWNIPRNMCVDIFLDRSSIHKEPQGKAD